GPLARHDEPHRELIAEARWQQILAGSRHPRPADPEPFGAVGSRHQAEAQRIQKLQLAILHEDEEAREVHDPCHVGIRKLDLAPDPESFHAVLLSSLQWLQYRRLKQRLRRLRWTSGTDRLPDWWACPSACDGDPSPETETEPL